MPQKLWSYVKQKRYCPGSVSALGRLFLDFCVWDAVFVFLCAFSGCGRDLRAVELDEVTLSGDSQEGSDQDTDLPQTAEKTGQSCAQTDQVKDSLSAAAVGPETDSSDSEDEIYVYICGCVRQPGVYSFVPGSRVYEAVEKAGGFLEEASLVSVNLALELKDQMQIYIPSVQECASGDGLEVITGAKDAALDHASEDTQGTDAAVLVNINTADAQRLMELPGIGPSKARDIIEYRETQGGFKSVEDLMNIPGIKNGVFEKIKDLVTVN